MPEPATSTSRVLLVDAGQPHDVFDVVEVTDALLRVRTAFLFDVGEEMMVRLEQNGAVFEAMARVLGHTGTTDDRITELELADRTAV